MSSTMMTMIMLAFIDVRTTRHAKLTMGHAMWAGHRAQGSFFVYAPRMQHMPY